MYWQDDTKKRQFASILPKDKTIQINSFDTHRKRSREKANALVVVGSDAMGGLLGLAFGPVGSIIGAAYWSCAAIWLAY